MAMAEQVRRWARVQKHEYTQGEDRPLGGFLGAMGVYSAVVAAGATAVRVSGRPLPERIPLGDAVLLTVATFRLARRIAKDPVTSPLRAPFATFHGASGEAELAEGLLGPAHQGALIGGFGRLVANQVGEATRNVRLPGELAQGG